MRLTNYPPIPEDEHIAVMKTFARLLADLGFDSERTPPLVMAHMLVRASYMALAEDHGHKVAREMIERVLDMEAASERGGAVH